MTTQSDRIYDLLCELTRDGAVPLVKDEFVTRCAELLDKKPEPTRNLFMGWDVGPIERQLSVYHEAKKRSVADDPVKPWQQVVCEQYASALRRKQEKTLCDAFGVSPDIMRGEVK